ncbi:MAG: chromosomal replication initiator protein DnaA [Fibrobacterales bacterium]
MSWEKCLDSLKNKLSDQIFSTHILGMKLVQVDDIHKKVIASLPMGADAQLINQSFKGMIEYEYLILKGQMYSFSFIQENRRHTPTFESNYGDKVFTQFPKVPLNPKYTFDSFVVGGNSQFAYSASDAVSNSPGSSKFNPLLIYGGSGLGKTHLIQAIGNRIKVNNPGKTIRYVVAEDFMREFVESLKNKTITEFSNYYRHDVDILLMDDIQFLSGKLETQNEFFHIFNALHQSGKQIVLTSDNSPSDVTGLEDRLISRFQWGLCVDIQQPDVETREAIIRKKSESDHLKLHDEIIEYLAINIDGNIRLIEGAIRKLTLLSSLKNDDITLEMAKEVVVGIPRATTRRINVDEIIEAISRYYNVEIDRILEGGRGTKEVAQARHIAMYLIKELSSLSLKSIGKRFGDRDHSTVVHSIKAVQKMMINDPSYRRGIEELKAKLQR